MRLPRLSQWFAIAAFSAPTFIANEWLPFAVFVGMVVLVMFLNGLDDA